jgi:hypothetical protein
MKKITTLLLLSIAFQSFAIDRFVNPNLSAGNGTTLFTNITSAINAAVNGDRIIVTSGTYNEAAITIGKSLQIMPQTPGTTINFNANITIAGFPGMKLEITGFNLGIYSISSSVIQNGNFNNRANINIIDCTLVNIDNNTNYYNCNLISNTITGNATLRYGNIIKNTIINDCIIYKEDVLNQSLTEKILITNNNISNRLIYFNDSYRFFIANNTLFDLIIKRWNPNVTLSNKILNNNFIDGSKINVSRTNVPYYNIIFSSNKFLGSVSFYSFTWPQYNTNGAQFSNYDSDIFYNDCGQIGWSTFCGYTLGGSNLFPNPIFPGYFQWTYNGVDFTSPTPTSGQPLVLTKIVGPTNEIDGGNPNHDYYDIDLTINDRGINGGPYSQFNYNAANPNNSKAFIFDLDMPSDLFPNQNVQIKSKGYHKN